MPQSFLWGNHSGPCGMKNKAITINLILLLILGSSTALAQAKESHAYRIEKVNVDFLSKGQSGFDGIQSQGLGGLTTTSASGKWARIEVQYTSLNEFADEITIEFYVLTQSNAILKGSITQNNIFRGKHHFAAVFLHPTTLQRFGAIKRVAVQISYSSEIKDSAEWPRASHKEWWTQSPAKEGYLKKVFQTPFILDQPGRYEDTKW